MVNEKIQEKYFKNNSYYHRELCEKLEGWEVVGWWVGRRFRREGTHVYLWLIHAVVWQKPIQYCKAINLR